MCGERHSRPRGALARAGECGAANALNTEMGCYLERAKAALIHFKTVYDVAAADMLELVNHAPALRAAVNELQGERARNRGLAAARRVGVADPDHVGAAR